MGLTSTYKSDLVSSFPTSVEQWRVFVHVSGGCGLLFALFIGSNEKSVDGFAIAVGVISLLVLDWVASGKKTIRSTSRCSGQLGQTLDVCSLWSSMGTVTRSNLRRTVPAGQS